MKEQIASYSKGWLELLGDLVTRAQESGELDAGEDAAQLAFELDAFLLMGNTAFLLHNDRATLDQARSAIGARLRIAHPR